MPNAQNLWCSKCMELKTLPHGIEYLTNLQQIYLADVSEELIGRIRGEESVDHPKVQHIPKIDHYYRTSSGWAYENLS
ncbi:hypothetical protein L1049_010102 [Liquidambar formosana]|uniref:Uncharacterized protein n=1 Tax=Liquidambar formosana TaxID=63359 RepID=A0AAP0N8I6_LIQFO